MSDELARGYWCAARGPEMRELRRKLGGELGWGQLMLPSTEVSSGETARSDRNLTKWMEGKTKKTRTGDEGSSFAWRVVKFQTSKEGLFIGLQGLGAFKGEDKLH